MLRSACVLVFLIGDPITFADRLAGSPITVQNTAEPQVHKRVRRAAQVNKSVLLKARVGTESAGAALALKSWWNPSSVVALSCTYPFAAHSPLPKLGFSFGCENFGGIRWAPATRPARGLWSNP